MMKKLKDFEEEIYKCSRCGLCQSVCPVYKVTLNECSVSRTKFNMLNGVLKGDLELNKKIFDYMDLCLGCNACKEFCPSDIDARKIFTAVKAEYIRKNNPLLINNFIFKFFLKITGFMLLIYRKLGLYKFSLPINNIIGKRLQLLNVLAKQNLKKIKLEHAPKTRKAVFFKGCFNQYLNSDSEIAVRQLLAKTDIEIVDVNFECCGVSFLSAGQEKEFLKIAKKNVSMIPDDCDFVITDCASCNFVLKYYKNCFPDKNIPKIVNVLELLDLMKIATNVSGLKVTAHKPCHENFDFISLLKNIEGIEYIESEDFDKCCGFSGKFAVSHSDVSREISKRKAEKIYASGANFVLTNCPACKLGLNQGLIEIGNREIVVLNVIEFVTKYCKVSIL